MKFIDITRKYGSTTYGYPFEDYSVNEHYRGLPKYVYDLCIGCSACGIACPPNAIKIVPNENGDKLIWEFDCGRCIFCGRCDEVCPTAAIRLSNEFELAISMNEEDMIQRGELDMECCTECKKPFSTKRLIDYTNERLKNANLSEGRLKDAQTYLKICPDCKKLMANGKIIRKEEGKIL